MDLSDILLGFEQINPGFELRGDPSELQRAAAQSAEALQEGNIVSRTIRFLQASKLRDWYNAESVEERERLHGEMRGLGELEQQLRQVMETNDAVQEDMRRESGISTLDFGE